MAWFHRIVLGARALVQNKRLERELDDELHDYLETAIEQKMTAGITREQAARAVRVDTGSLEAVKENVRDAGWESRVEAFCQDAGYAIRLMRRAPALTTVVVVTIAIGIGAATSMFGVMRNLLLAPPPHVAASEHVFRLHQMFPAQPPHYEQGIGNRTSYPFYELLSDRAESLDALAAYTSADLAVGTGSDARMAHATMVSAGFWRTLGPRAAVGRFIHDDEAHPATGSRVVVLGHAFWQRHLDGNGDAIGRTLRIKGQPYEIIGVAPRGFRGVELADVDLWLPLFAKEDGSGRAVAWHTFPTSYNLTVVARLEAGASAERASSELTVLQRSFLAEAYGGALGDSARDAALRDRHRNARVLLGGITGGVGVDLRPIPEARIARWLVGLAFVLLAVACSNVAGLLLLRAVRRGREMAVRLALGATPARLASQLLTESMVLALLGGFAAVVTVVWSGAWLHRTLLPALAWEPVTLFDSSVIGVAVVSTLGTALVTGMAPLYYARSDAFTGLRTGILRGPLRRPMVLNLLLVIQGALSVVLLVGAGLFVRSLHQAQTADIGLDRENVLAVEVDFSGTGRSDGDAAAFFERALERAAVVPGVTHASLALSVPLRSARGGGSVRLPGRDRPTLPTGGPYVNVVTPAFFSTAGMRIRQGRGFVEEDRSRGGVIVVNETMATRYWPDRTPVGECVHLGREKTCTTVVGVVADAHRFRIIEEERYAYYYRPMRRDETDSRALLVRVAPGADWVRPALRQALLEQNGSLPFIKIETLGEALSPQMRPWRLGAAVFTAFGLIAMMLAVIGLASSVAYAVSQRTHEFAVRLALGAHRASLMRLMLWDGIRGALIATTTGLVIGGWGSGFIADLLYRVSPHDPLVFGTIAAAILIAAGVASVLPAWRVSRIDPAAALRAE